MNTHRKRIEACLSNQAPDRLPIALWRHFPVDDQTPDGLARATLAFQRNFDFDVIKVTPSSSYCLKDWGAEDAWRGASEGTRDYTRRVIQHPEDWENLPTLDPRKGNLNDQLQCLSILKEEIGIETPIIQTIFNPLAQAKNLAGGENLLVYMRRYPQALHAGLKTITETTLRFIEAVKKTGIAGIFYAVQHAQYSLLSSEEYHIFGRSYDLQILETTQDMWLKMLHLHGKDVMFEMFNEYPVEVINWHDRETPPSIGEGKNLFKNIVCGGIQRDTMLLGTPDQVKSEAQEAIDVTSGKRLILGTGCVVPITAPYGNILAVRQVVE
jgi:uroporphyrinogen decarboxylase